MGFDFADWCCCKRPVTMKHVPKNDIKPLFNVEMHVIPSPTQDFIESARPRSMSDCTEQVIVHDLQYSDHAAEHVTKDLQRSFSNPCKRAYYANHHYSLPC